MTKIKANEDNDLKYMQLTDEEEEERKKKKITEAASKSDSKLEYFTE